MPCAASAFVYLDHFIVSTAALEVTVCPPLPVTTHRNLYPLWAAAAVKLRVAVLFPFAPESFQVFPPSVLACHW